MLPMWGTTPPLRSPILMAAFDGWNDAGEAASVALRHLCTVWGADLVGTVNPQDYYDFQVNRPRVQLVDGRREIDVYKRQDPDRPLALPGPAPGRRDGHHGACLLYTSRCV